MIICSYVCMFILSVGVRSASLRETGAFCPTVRYDCRFDKSEFVKLGKENAWNGGVPRVKHIQLADGGDASGVGGFDALDVCAEVA